jgi:hypothetical protein
VVRTLFKDAIPREGTLRLRTVRASILKVGMTLRSTNRRRKRGEGEDGERGRMSVHCRRLLWSEDEVRSEVLAGGFQLISRRYYWLLGGVSVHRKGVFAHRVGRLFCR